MYLKLLKLWNFRKYGHDDNVIDILKPDLEVPFKNGLNLLIGENESGKSTIVDAIKYVLLTQSQEYIRVSEDDFFKDSIRRTDLRIECIFSGFNTKEAGNFLEWIGFDDKKEFILRIWIYAKIKNNQVTYDVKAGMDDEGTSLDNKARDLLRITYLKPLRDATVEMSAGRKSRFAQLLKSHSIFDLTYEEKQTHELATAVSNADTAIESFFKILEDENLLIKGIGIHDLEQNSKHGSRITREIKKHLEDFTGDTKSPFVTISGKELWEIFHQLNLSVDEHQTSLGIQNLLYMAAEFLMLQRPEHTGLKLAAIEELEAHLHPNFQLNVLKAIEMNKNMQYILTTHSTILGSSIKLENMIICKENCVYPMGADDTKLDTDGYKFLEMFLDATKANLFFCKGVIIVEGDSENLLIPAIAESIGHPLHKHGVSIINVGSTAFKRYARVFERKNEPLSMHIRVAIVNDGDIPVKEHIRNKGLSVYKHTIDGEDIIEKERKRFLAKTNLPKTINWDDFTIELKDDKDIDKYLELLTTLAKDDTAEFKNSDIQFFSNGWTLEYSIAESIINEEFLRAMKKAQEISGVSVTLPPNTDDKLALMKPILGNLSKALTAQCLAEIIKADLTLGQKILNDGQLKYIVNAIKHACNAAQV